MIDTGHLCYLKFVVMGILNDKRMIVDDLESRTDMTEKLFCFLNLSLRSNQELSLNKGPSLKICDRLYIYAMHHILLSFVTCFQPTA